MYNLECLEKLQKLMKPNLESPNLIERIMDVWKDEKR
jgi:hypothetical protein